MRSLTDAIRERRSVRAYTGGLIPMETRRRLENAIRELSVPGVTVTLQDNNLGSGKLGTYGIVRDAPAFLVLCCGNEPESLLRAGILGEKLVVLCGILGLGTVWLGGTFSRRQFNLRVSPSEHEIIPCVIAVGIPADRENFLHRLMRRGAGSDSRRDWNELFFINDFDHFLPKEDDALTDALEMVRLAPSAQNKQPWRVVKAGERVHFYLCRDSEKPLGIDIQMLDVGIGMAHFELILSEREQEGHWYTEDPGLECPPRVFYVRTWEALE